jgi:hypothetical protein
MLVKKPLLEIKKLLEIILNLFLGKKIIYSNYLKNSQFGKNKKNKGVIKIFLELYPHQK